MSKSITKFNNGVMEHIVLHDDGSPMGIELSMRIVELPEDYTFKRFRCLLKSFGINQPINISIEKARNILLYESQITDIRIQNNELVITIEE